MKVDIIEGLDADRPRTSNDYLLVRELTHRVNNEFTSMIELISLTAARSSCDEVKNALTGVMNLLYDYAGGHRALEMPTHSTVIDASDYIRALCQSIRRTKLDRREIELVLVEHPLQMRSERCWKLGMIVSELITNSARHAFDDRGGTIRIELSGSGRFAECCVMDNGSSRGCDKPGQGLKIVEALARELNGEIVHHFGADGAQSVLIFPISGEPLQTPNGALIDDDWVSGNLPPRPSNQDRPPCRETVWALFTRFPPHEVETAMRYLRPSPKSAPTDGR
jgi:two-component sensor histidine kinase